MMEIVGLVLVRNEDVFVERAIRNVAEFCDRIFVVDHMSDDNTWDIVCELARSFDHVDPRRSRNSADAHRLVAPFAGTPTWVLGVDGDELYDPAGLARFRSELLEGAHADVFRLKAHVLNCDRLDGGTASGWLAPPSRPITKLFNFGAITSWPETPEPLQAGAVVFKQGYEWESRRDLAESSTWDTDPLRCLHVCFLRRSSCDRDGVRAGRKSLAESREFERGFVGSLKRALKRPHVPSNIAALEQHGTNWKREWYARGDRVTVDAAPFLGKVAADAPH